MSNYTPLWTSTSDKEFKELSKHHSLQKRRLDLRMVGIEREHKRHVKRVRTEMRETTTLVEQYEKEKEQRARHLLKVFSKVHKRREAAADWRQAHARKASTFDVKIGRGRRSSSISETSGSSSRRSSVFSDSSSPRRASLPPLVKASAAVFSSFLHKSRQTESSAAGSRSGSNTLLPPIPLARRGSADSSLGGRSGGRSSRLSSSGRPRLDSISEEDMHRQGTPTSDDEDTSSETSSQAARHARGDDLKRKRRQVIWTETFPFVYHSVGETVCPRYSLFLQYDEYKVFPKAKPRPSLLGLGKVKVKEERKEQSKSDEDKKFTFRSLAKTLGLLQSNLNG